MSEYVVSTTIGDYIYTLDPKFRLGNVFPPVTSFPQTYNISKSGYIAPFGSIIVDYTTNSISSKKLTINLLNGETSAEDSVIKVVYNGTNSITISKKSSPAGLGIQGYNVGGCATGNESSYPISCTVADNTLSSYLDPLSNVPYLDLPVTIMDIGFSNCTNLITAPVIPSSVTSMSDCFHNCQSLVTAPVIPSGVTDMNSCFAYCSALTIAPEIPSSVTNMSSCFDNCTSLTTAPVIPYDVDFVHSCFKECTLLEGDIYIQSAQLVSYVSCFQGTTKPITLHGNNISILEALASTTTNNNIYINTTPTTLPSTMECAPMNYQTDNGLVQLSPQTDASLVSVQVPNGSGTITTTLEDALVDLYSRTPSIGTSITQPITVSGVTFTPLGNGVIRVNGTSTAVIEQDVISSDIKTGGIYSVSGLSAVIKLPNPTVTNPYNNCRFYFDRIHLDMRTNGDSVLPTPIPTYMLYDDEDPSSIEEIQAVIIKTYIPKNTTFNNVIIKPELRWVGDYNG